jgi:hypothetical protein
MRFGSTAKHLASGFTQLIQLTCGLTQRFHVLKVPDSTDDIWHVGIT